MAKQKSDFDDPVYSRIVINKAKQYGNIVGVCVMSLIVASFIYANLLFEVHWGVIAFPACLMASVLLLAPVSEEWLYKPWQRYPQQVERHYLD